MVEAACGRVRPRVAVYGCAWLHISYMIACGCIWPRVAIYGRVWLAAYGCVSVSVGVHVCVCVWVRVYVLRMPAYGHVWLHMAAYGCI